MPNRKPNNAKRIPTKKESKRVPKRAPRRIQNNNEDKEIKIKNKKNKKKSKIGKIIKWTIIIGILLVLIAAGIIAGMIFGILKKEVISVDKLRISKENTVVYDTEGRVIGTLNADEKREVVSITEMSKYIPSAFVAIEDERFYEHQGVDIKRTLAATFKYLTHRGNSNFGGSTITQQLVKNITKEDERDAMRKIKEMARAYNLEKVMTKDEILELYLNMIFMGEDVYGVQMASKLYFNKSAKELDLAESAFLAGINNSPNAYKPFSTDESMQEKIKARTKTVIEKMHELGRIETEEEYNAAIEKVNNGLPFKKGNINANNFSYHTDATINQVIEDIQKANPDMTKQAAEFYVYNSGLKIYSTQDSHYQTVMEREYEKSAYVLNSRKYNKKDAEGNDTGVPETTQSAMALIDHKTGQVLATVGGLGEKTSRGLNRATQGTKQPGSSIKPIGVIAPGLEAGIITAATVVDDSPIRIGNWTPKNSGGGYMGLMQVREILKYSKNVPEVKMLQQIGPENAVEFLKKLGITTVGEADANLALALGGLSTGVSPLQMAAAYACIANDGVYIEPKFYTKVVDSAGNVILEAKPETRTVMSAENAYIIKNILQGAVSGGTATGAWISNMDVAAKTGTTDNYTERWLCGFTPYYTAATWYGFDNTETIPNGGVNTAMTIWGNVMREIHSDLETKRFERPANIVTATVCTKSGLLPTDLCRNVGCTRSEIFVKGTVPTETCTTHAMANVCSETGKLATEFCPHVSTGIFIIRPNSDTDKSWQSANDAKETLPTDFCDVHTHPIEPEVVESPEASSSPSTTPSGNPTVVITSPTPSTDPTSNPTPAASPVAVSPVPSVEPTGTTP